ncbi:MAG: type IV pilin-like G/H family protein [Pseudanabaenaceae cyanobacterium]
MKSEFKAKLIQHLLSKKNDEQGFTLIELLVVIIIIGILAAIALPSFLNQANKGKQSEARTYVGSLNKGQQGYYTEKSKFGTQDTVLGVGLNTNTANYNYASFTAADATAANRVTSILPTAGAYSTTAAVAVSIGGSKVAALRSYSGMVSLSQVLSTSDVTSLAVVCESNAPGSIATATQNGFTVPTLAATSMPSSGTACDSSAQVMGN